MKKNKKVVKVIGRGVIAHEITLSTVEIMLLLNSIGNLADSGKLDETMGRFGALLQDAVDMQDAFQQ